MLKPSNYKSDILKLNYHTIKNQKNINKKNNIKRVKQHLQNVSIK